MSKKQVQRKHRKEVSRSRRRKRKAAMTVTFAAILLSATMIFGFARNTDIQNELQPLTLAFDTQTGSSQSSVSGTENGKEQFPDTGTPWYLTLVNKQHPISKDYEPELIKVQGGEHVDKRIYEPLMEMLEDAKTTNLGQLPRVVSGYRTADTQLELYNQKIEKFKKEGYSESEAKAQAEQWVALPGHSEHQLGLAVDINGAVYDVYSWLQENSYKYGFIFRYPGSKTQIADIAEEVWHYRYVGPDAAAEIYEQGLCLEEYLENIPKNAAPK